MRTAIGDGLALCIGMMIVPAIAHGYFEPEGKTLVISLIVGFFVAGILLRRTLWTKLGLAMRVASVAVGFGLLTVIVPELIFTVGREGGFWKVLVGDLSGMVFYWAPLVLGLLVGGIAARDKNAEQE